VDPNSIQPGSGEAEKGDSPLRPHGRGPLLILCLATALVCGVAAGALGPRVLVGSVSPAVPATATEMREAVDEVPAPLGLSERLGIDTLQAKADEKRWAAMPESERRLLVGRYRELAGMDDAQRGPLLQKYAAFRQLPADQQTALRRRAADLASLLKSLSPQDQARLESLSTDHDRALRLLELWQARKEG
jgi:hypothetical protein